MAGENKLANNRKMTGKNLHNKYERKKNNMATKIPIYCGKASWQREKQERDVNKTSTKL